MSNPYTIELCDPQEGACGKCQCQYRERHDAWNEGFNAGLEAAAERCEVEHAELEEIARGQSGRIRTMTEERALVCAQLADEIRDMKGDNQ